MRSAMVGFGALAALIVVAGSMVSGARPAAAALRGALGAGIGFAAAAVVAEARRVSAETQTTAEAR